VIDESFPRRLNVNYAGYEIRYRRLAIDSTAARELIRFDNPTSGRRKEKKK
jgi:hypothetical protein